MATRELEAGKQILVDYGPDFATLEPVNGSSQEDIYGGTTDEAESPAALRLTMDLTKDPTDPDQEHDDDDDPLAGMKPTKRGGRRIPKRKAAQSGEPKKGAKRRLETDTPASSKKAPASSKKAPASSKKAADPKGSSGPGPATPPSSPHRPD